MSRKLKIPKSLTRPVASDYISEAIRRLGEMRSDSPIDPSINECRDELIQLLPKVIAVEAIIYGRVPGSHLSGQEDS